VSGRLTQNSDFDNLARLDGLQRRQSIRYMRANVIQIVRSWADYQDSDVPARDILLIADVFVYGDEDVKALVSQGQQFSVLFAAESRISNGLTFVTALGEQELHFPGQTLVNE
jgi:hypothetical protein